LPDPSPLPDPSSLASLLPPVEIKVASKSISF
jgi:hypothetical protein